MGSFQCQLVNIRVYVKEIIVEGDQEVSEKANVDGADLTLREAQASVDC